DIRERGHVAIRNRDHRRLLHLRFSIAKRDGAKRHRAIDVRSTTGVDQTTATRADVMGRPDGVWDAIERFRSLAARGGTGRKDGIRTRAPVYLFGVLRSALIATVFVDGFGVLLYRLRLAISLDIG